MRPRGWVDNLKTGWVISLKNGWVVWLKNQASKWVISLKIDTLKDQLAKFSIEDSNKDSLELLLSDIKTSQKHEGEQTSAMLRGIQFRLKTFRQELAVLNSNFQRILDRGELLKLEDLRQLQSTMAQERREAEREERKEDVEKLLEHFTRERQESIH